MDRNAYVREWRRQIASGERVPRRYAAHPSPWCRHHEECRWMRSVWNAAERSGTDPTKAVAAHPWGHSCPSCARRLARFERKATKVVLVEKPALVCRGCGVSVSEHDLMKRCAS